MLEEQLQLQIALNVGTKRYEIKVPKKTDLSALVQKFLQDNQLNLKNHSTILRLVKDKLDEQKLKGQQTIREQSDTTLQSKEKEFHSQVIKPKKITSDVTVNNNKTKNLLLQKIEREIQSKNNENPPDSRKVYEQWKQKQKDKKVKDGKPQKASYQTSRIATQRQKHQPDFFYKKGIQFQKQCEKNSDNSFKKLYPFKITDRHLTELDQQKLYNRLSKEKLDRNPKNYLQKYCNEIPPPKQLIRQDPIKQHVRQEDDKIDRLVFKMIKQRSVTPRKLERSASKSPFRKTLIK